MITKSELCGWVEYWVSALKVLFLAVRGLYVTTNKQDDPFLHRHVVSRSDLPILIRARTQTRLRVKLSPSLTCFQKATV